PIRGREIGFGGAATYGFEHGIPAQTDLGQWKTQGQTTIFQYVTGTSLMDTAVADGRHWRANAQAEYFVGPIGVLAEYARSQQHVAFQQSHAIVSADAWQVLGQWVVTGGRATYKGVIPDPGQDAIVLAARVTGIRLN